MINRFASEKHDRVVIQVTRLRLFRVPNGQTGERRAYAHAEEENMLNWQLQPIDFQGDMVPPTVGPPYSSDGHPALYLTPTEPYGSALYSPSGAFRLHLQTDGNAVVEVVDDAVLPRTWQSGEPLNPNAVSWLSPPLWASGTNDKGVIELAMQNDGNLVIYTGSGGIGISDSSGPENQGVFLRMQDDGNLVVYGPNGKIWDTKTNVPGG
jgi:hypothetical protein